MQLPKKEELVKELKAVINGAYERSVKEINEDAEKLKNKHVEKVKEIVSTISL